MLPLEPAFLVKTSLPVLIILALIGGVGGASCPWDEAGLALWSNPRTWKTGKVPSTNEHVIITPGKRVLLDIQPPELKTLTIPKKAALIWGNVDKLTMTVIYIAVSGEFHIGAEDCLFTKQANIKLNGTYNTPDKLEGNETKGIFVLEGGTLELHGAKKTSWTRLAQTIPRVAETSCPMIFNPQSSRDNRFIREKARGLHVIIWNEDASVYDYQVFDTFNNFQQFFQDVPDGKVIGMYAYKNVKQWNSAYQRNLFNTTIKTLGGNGASNIRNSFYTYSFLTMKGSPHMTSDYVKFNGQKTRREHQSGHYLSLKSPTQDLEFQIGTSSFQKSVWYRVMNAQITHPYIQLAENVTGWNPGDKVIVASTDFRWEQAEIRTLVECRHCQKHTVRVKGKFDHSHYGRVTYGVDERAEVGLLTRNIKIEGIMADKCYHVNLHTRKLCNYFQKDTFGGEIKVLRGFKQVHIQGVELFHMGKQIKEGHYPMHFHMVDSAKGSWFKFNSIHVSFSRCVTIHGTDDALIEGNVCYDHLGHGFHLEDSVEQNNELINNLGLGTKHGTLALSDMEKASDFCPKAFKVNCDEVSTFWITHPNNVIRGNSAAGSMAHGIMYVFADAPLGLSFDRQLVLGKVTNYSARSYPIKEFDNNYMHSNRRSGLFFDSTISTGKHWSRDTNVPMGGIIQEQHQYEPRDPPGDVNGTRVWTTMSRVTAYKNFQNNVWLKGGNIRVVYSSFADASMQSFSGGNTDFDTGTSIEHSIFIGESENKGEPYTFNDDSFQHTFNKSFGQTPLTTTVGVALYQGPMLIKHSFFDKYKTEKWANYHTRSDYPAVTHRAAISFKRDSTYPYYTSQYTTNVTFGFCDNVDDQHWLLKGNDSMYKWQDTDGPKNAFNFDRNGSLTGTPNVSIVNNRPFFTGPECMVRDDWHMAVCPYKYYKLEFLGKSSADPGGIMSDDARREWPIVVHRDDARSDPYYQESKQRREFLLRTYTSYLFGFNSSVPNVLFPKFLVLEGKSIETQDVGRIGICVPLDLTEFKISSIYPEPFDNDNVTMVNSLKELDNDTTGRAVFHDKTKGVIFVRIWSKHNRTNDTQKCSAGHCYHLKFVFLNGTRYPIRSCDGVYVRSFKDNRPRPAKVTPKPCPPLGSTQGIGAVRYDELGRTMKEDLSLTCPASRPIREDVDKEHIGCFVLATQKLSVVSRLNTMDVDWCALRCNQREYKYAAISIKKCYCTNVVNRSPAALNVRNRKCKKTCPGNRSQKCGNGYRVSIWSTGYNENVSHSNYYRF